MAKSETRRKSRELAFKTLYSLNFLPARDTQELARACLFSSQTGRGENPAAAQQGFAWDLVEGVWRNAEDLDGIINAHSRNWRTDRMGKIELTLLRLALYELLWLKDAPPKVIINEALELVGQFGERSAKALVNGILDAAMKNPGCGPDKAS